MSDNSSAPTFGQKSNSESGSAVSVEVIAAVPKTSQVLPPLPPPVVAPGYWLIRRSASAPRSLHHLQALRQVLPDGGEERATKAEAGDAHENDGI